MMRLFWIIGIIWLCVPAAYGQESELSSVADRFEQDYNQGKYTDIFARFSQEMKKALPYEKTVSFLSGLKSQIGSIREKSLLQQQGGSMAYKAIFERGVFVLQLVVDDSVKIAGLFIKPYLIQEVPVIERNLTSLSLPFQEEWTVFWGGDTKETNYHISHKAQKNAFDFVIMDESGKTFRINGKENEDYYAFGKKILSPCEGEVVLAVDGVKENKVGMMNAIFPIGNTVILKTLNNEYLVFAHFKQFSVQVKQGDQVKVGQVLGECGNTGNSSEPHLHFHLQNTEEWDYATGIKCYFNKIVVDGHEKVDYSPVKEERVRNNK